MLLAEELSNTTRIPSRFLSLLPQSTSIIDVHLLWWEQKRDKNAAQNLMKHQAQTIEKQAK